MTGQTALRSTLTVFLAAAVGIASASCRSAPVEAAQVTEARAPQPATAVGDGASLASRLAGMRLHEMCNT